MGIEIGSSAYNRVSVDMGAERSRATRTEKESAKVSADSFTKTEDAPERKDAAAGEGAVYESNSTRGSYTVDTETIERLKAESEQRMTNLVKQMLGQQVTRSNVLDALSAGRFSAEEIEQAKKDTADDGYWGVEQTSDRFVQYATALTGGDPDKLDAMIEAFEKGYAEAEKQWGGELPELAQRTREATLKKFQDLKDKYAQDGNAAVSAAAQSLLESKTTEAAAAV